MKKKSLPIIGALSLAVLAASFNFGPHQASATVPGNNTLLTVRWNAPTTAVTSGGSSNYKLSANGKFALFGSGASTVVSSDTNGQADVFVRNLATNTTTRVSVSSSGVQADAGGGSSVISATGRYIAFKSQSTNLIDGTSTDGTYYQLYLRDTKTNTTSLLSKTSSGTLADKGVTNLYGISSDGRFVLFDSNSTNLAPTGGNNRWNLYMLDRDAGTFTIIDTKSDGTLQTGNNASYASMSCDGSLVVFQGPNALISGQDSGHQDIYMVDRRAGSKLVDLSVNFNHEAGYPVISCNGDYIGFQSSAYNLDPAFSANLYGHDHYYMFDRTNGTYSLLDQSTSGSLGNAVSCGTSNYCLDISDTGIAAFTSSSTNLVSATSAYAQLYIRNTNTGTTEALSQDSSGTLGNGISMGIISISSHGDIVTYMSNATNLNSTYSDTNGTGDVYLSQTGI